jgi:ppGpp synthetase/RelA/SpoT-type nucleotidyltranferase
MPFSAELISPAVARYRRERDRYVKLADRVTEICREDVCEQNAIRAQVTFRVKTEKSFEGKLRRFVGQDARNYNNVDEIFQSIGDLAGVRISAYQEEDCERIVERLKGVFCGPSGEPDIEIDRKDKKTPLNQNFYRAIHVQVALPEDQLIGTYDNVGDISCEIQICTMIAHVWNEIEHDIGYKPDLGGPSHDEGYNLNQLGLLVRQGDTCISALMAAHDQRAPGQAQHQAINDPTRPFVDVHDFVSRMRDFSDQAMTNFAENSGQLFDLLTDLGEISPQAILAILNDFDAERYCARLAQLNESLAAAGVDGLSLDPDTSDLMLIALIEREPDRIRAALKGRAGRGKGRPSRLHRIAVRYLDQA